MEPPAGRSNTAIVRKQGAWMFLASMTNSGMGFIFWALAARTFPDPFVGTAGSVISLASLGTSLAILGLDNSLVRFITKVDRPRRLIRQLVLVSGVLAVGVGAGLMVVVLSVGLAGNEALVAVILLGTALTVFQVWFQISDSSLLAAGRNELLAGRSIAYGAGKILLLLAVTGMGLLGLLLAYTVPLLIVVAGAFVISGFLWPAVNPQGRPHRLGEFASLSLGNYASGLLWFLPNRLAPALILIVYSADEAAYFFLAFMLAEVLNYIPESVGKSLFAQGSRSDAISTSTMRDVRVWLTLVMVPLVAVGIVLSEFGMDLLGGPNYSAHAPILQIFLVAVLPRTGLQLLKARFNVEKRMGDLVVLGAATGLSTLAFFAVALAMRPDIDVVPIAWVLGGVVGLGAGLAAARARVNWPRQFPSKPT